MAASFTCDGCGCPVENPEVIGFVLKRDYCPACREEAAEFLAEEEKLRTDLHAKFTTKRQKMIEAMSKRGFKLPDTP